jgi:hypothetical protein
VIIFLPKPFPIYRQTLLDFAAPEPWAQDRLVNWILALYHYGPPTLQIDRTVSAIEMKNSVPPGHVLGLFCRETNRCVLIPQSLLGLWQTGQVTTDALPRLLFLAERGGKEDKHFAWVLPSLRAASVILFTLGIVLVVAGAVLFKLGYLEPAIMAGFLAAMFIPFGGIMMAQMWLAKRRQRRFESQWLSLLGK